MSDETAKLKIKRTEVKKILEDRLSSGRKFLNEEINSEEKLQYMRSEFRKWNSYNRELLRKIFTTDEILSEYDGYHFGTRNTYGLEQEISMFNNDLKEKIEKLESIINKLELYDRAIQDNKIENDQFDKNKVFIVHGHNNELKQNVARTIEKLGLNSIILHEQPNMGQTIIEKLEKNSDVGFAIVLLTPDDLGKAKNNENFKKRARQNVIAELGYFIGKLGRDRVCPIYIKNVEIPSDFSGVLYVEYDSSDNWMFKLVKELKAVGYKADANKLINFT